MSALYCGVALTPQQERGDSPEYWVTYFSQNIGGITPSWKFETHKAACEQALAMLRASSSNNPRLAGIVAELEAKFKAALAAKRRVEWGLYGFVGVFVAFMTVFVTYMAIQQESGHSAARKEVQKLIQEGRFDEARVRALDLESNKKKEMMKVIDDAEKRRGDSQ